MPEKTDVYALGILIVRIATLKDEFIGLESIEPTFPFLAELVSDMLHDEAENRINYRQILYRIEYSNIKL
jgi:hypothetical protein